MTDSEKVARLEKAVANQDQRLDGNEKNAIRLEKDVRQHDRDIERIEMQSEKRFEHVLSRLDAGFNRVEISLKSDIDRVETGLRSDIDRVETSLKSDIDRVETELKTDRRWFNGLVVTSVIGGIAILVNAILWALKYFDFSPK